MEMDFELIKLIFDNLEYPLYLNDRSGKTLCANDALLRLYHCNRDEFERLYADVYHLKDDGVYASTIFERVLQQKEAVCDWSEVIIPRHKSSINLVSQSPIFDQDGNVKYVVGVNFPLEMIRQQYPNAKIEKQNIDHIRIVSNQSNPFLYKSTKMMRLVRMLNRIASTSATVLVCGETGVGKEVIANYIHTHSLCAKKKMVSLNCAALSPSLFEAEMFGYEKGAFTGANSAGKTGLVEAARDSTLFLDEVDSLPMELQGKLLRTLETKTIRKVGSNQTTNVEFRLVAATNKNLKQLVDEGKFRPDLYYRLDVLSVQIPPLRERQEDIPILADHFLENACNMYGLEKHFLPEAYQKLCSYDWPGNVRELRNVIERTALTSELSAIDEDSILLSGKKKETSSISAVYSADQTDSQIPLTFDCLSEQIGAYEKKIIEQALNTYGSPSKVARKLNVNLSTLLRKMEKYGLKSERN